MAFHQQLQLLFSALWKLAGSLNGWMNKWRERDGRGRWRDAMVTEFTSFAVAFLFILLVNDDASVALPIGPSASCLILVWDLQRNEKGFFVSNDVFSLCTWTSTCFIFIHRRNGAVSSATAVQIVEEQSPLMNILPNMISLCTSTCIYTCLAETKFIYLLLFSTIVNKYNLEFPSFNIEEFCFSPLPSV